MAVDARISAKPAFPILPAYLAAVPGSAGGVFYSLGAGEGVFYGGAVCGADHY